MGFPPMYAGGLGPDCYGLTKELSKHADITLILPQSDENFKMLNVEIIGLNNWIKKGGSRQPRKVEISRQEEEQKMDRQSRKIEIRSKQVVIENDRQPRKVEIKDEELLVEKYHQPRKVKVNRLPELFETEFSIYPLSMPRKALERISFFGKTVFTKSERIPVEAETTFTEEETQSLFSEQNIYGPNIMEKVAA